jgi:formylglycine-generating enzyme required for sulfatase activity
VTALAHSAAQRRQPTEAEWEKAARCDLRDPLGASSERRYPWGDSEDLSRRNN